jgi:hypothetical protein
MSHQEIEQPREEEIKLNEDAYEGTTEPNPVLNIVDESIVSVPPKKKKRKKKTKTTIAYIEDISMAQQPTFSAKTKLTLPNHAFSPPTLPSFDEKMREKLAIRKMKSIDKLLLDLREESSSPLTDFPVENVRNDVEEKKQRINFILPAYYWENNKFSEEKTQLILPALCMQEKEIQKQFGDKDSLYINDIEGILKNDASTDITIKISDKFSYDPSKGKQIIIKLPKEKIKNLVECLSTQNDAVSSSQNEVSLKNEKTIFELKAQESKEFPKSFFNIQTKTANDDALLTNVLIKWKK